MEQWIAHALRAAGCLARVWYRRWLSRRELARVEPRLLRDAGIPVIEANREARKPFWRG